MSKAFNDLGLDPESGIGRAAAVKFEGEAEDLAEFVAEQFDYFGSAHPMAGAITAAQGRLDKLGETAGTMPPIPTADQKLAKAEAKGDYKTTLEIKSRQLGNMLDGSR